MKRKIDSLFYKLEIYFSAYRLIALGIIITLVSLFMLNETSDYVQNGGLNVVDNAAFAPRLIYSVLFLLGILIFIQELVKNKAVRKAILGSTVKKEVIAGNQKSLIVLGSILLFILLMLLIGFIAASIIYLVFNMIIMNSKESRNIKLYFIIAVIASVVVYFCFKEFIYVNLPTGALVKSVLGR